MKALPIVVSVSVLALQGCTAIGGGLIWLLASPEPARCQMFTDILASEEPSTTTPLHVEVSGGWLRDPLKLTFEPTQAGERTTWRSGQGGYYSLPDNIPCRMSTPLEIKATGTDGLKRTAVILLKDLPQAPVLGSFYLGVTSEKARLALSENKGKTQTTLHAGKLWVLEPRRELVRVPLLLPEAEPPAHSEDAKPRNPWSREPG